MKKAIAAGAALLALAACEAKVGTEDAAAEVNASAEGRSEDNVMSISAPGFDMKIDIPAGIRDSANVDSDGDLLYPGSSFAGMHVQGGGETGSVELRFNTADDAGRVAAWYRDAARTKFKIDHAARDGDAILLTGHQTEENAPFKLRLDPRQGGGTQGILSLQGQ